METQYLLSPARRLTEEECSLVWKKPKTHIISQAEQRIAQAVKHNWNRGEMKITNILLEGDAGSGKTQLAKALSSDFGLPYTKVTCFADMDKSDILGSILPVLSKESGEHVPVTYQYYPSEIVRAYENGWLLEIQEPTVIRDAAVLMALNSALEPDGSLNLPDRIVRRHPDFVTVITTNRSYNGCRPLNEALRDRIQHAEKMDLPSIDVMMARASAKTGCNHEGILRPFAKTIQILDQTAKANAIKGVAGMRSFFYWVDAVMQGSEIMEALYQKVLYKITTDPDELVLLEQALLAEGMMVKLAQISNLDIRTGLIQPSGQTDGNIMEIHTEGRMESLLSKHDEKNPPPTALRKSGDSEDQSGGISEHVEDTQSTDQNGNGNAIYHVHRETEKIDLQQQKREFRKQQNRQVRQLVQGSIHEKINLIVHRPESTIQNQQEYEQIASEVMPVIKQLVRKTRPILEFEASSDFVKSRVYGIKFHAEKMAVPDYRVFSKKNTPREEPSLAVVLRVDESASMNAFGRLEAAKRAAVAVYEFCVQCGIPILIYGDTADSSPKEKMSFYSYIDWDKDAHNDKYSLMCMNGRSNNRDGMAIRMLSERLSSAPQKTKLLISLSDGQPKAMPDYSGEAAISDMQQIIGDYSRRGILFLAAAIGQDKETICEIYGQERFLDITDLYLLPKRLVQVIARYL